MKNKFTESYLGELYKASRRGTLIKLAVAILVIIIFITIIYSALNNLLVDVGVGNDLSFLQYQENDEAIEYYKQVIESLENTNSNKIGLTDNTLYQAKAQLAKYEYLKANGLTSANVTDFASNVSLNANSYVFTIMSIVTTILIIFSIVMSSKNMAGEISRGTMKMQLLRPIRRSTVFTSKYLSTFSICIIFYVVAAIFAEIFGLIKYGTSNKSILVVCDASKVFLIAPGVDFIIIMLKDLLTIFAYIQMTYFIGSFCKEKSPTSATVWPLLIYLFGSEVASLLGYIYVGYASFSLNLEWVKALTLTGPALKYMTVYSMLIISLVWLVSMTMWNYYSFKNRDIN